LAAVTPTLAKKKPVQDCKVSFGFAYIDRLNNNYRGIQGKQLKQVQDKLKKYGDVCYTSDDANADYIFFVHTKPAVYHGVQTTNNTSTHTDSNPVSGTITDEDGNRSRISGTVDTTTTTTTSSSVPYEVDYTVFTLDIMVPKPRSNGTTEYSTLHTFDQKGLYNTMYGIGYGKGKNPIVNVIDAAAKWLHETHAANQAVAETEKVKSVTQPQAKPDDWFTVTVTEIQRSHDTCTVTAQTDTVRFVLSSMDPRDCSDFESGKTYRAMRRKAGDDNIILEFSHVDTLILIRSFTVTNEKVEQRTSPN
jgi:hypothetical protein